MRVRVLVRARACACAYVCVCVCVCESVAGAFPDSRAGVLCSPVVFASVSVCLSAHDGMSGGFVSHVHCMSVCLLCMCVCVRAC